ncbi:MAG: sigma-70 family RNA polymerase sigma factor [Ruminococcaceae bacterium]|nr:sigma-70 family RNA polymerase sigma factor [Oscillospiraceae bacterium]
MDDAKIVQLYWARNEQAIPATADKYGNYCASIAKNILGNKEDSDECVNDTYLNAWNSIPPHRPSVLSAFLGKITRNLALNRYKHNTASKRGGGQTVEIFDEIAEIVSGTNGVEQEINRKELLRAIGGFLDRLPMDKKSIFVCRYWYFDSIFDIANQFGMTENNVSVTLNRLRLKLRKYLLERGYEL